MSRLDLSSVLSQQRLVLCGGSGGVGKTTTAAALGLIGAALGRRTLVLTIDPARRLASAMGLAQIGHQPTPVAQVPGLSVMMLNAGESVEELVARHAPNAAVRKALLGNPYYQQITAAVAGSREFVAMEKLHELLDDERYDLLIVDTPPSQHALDFLDAPKRLLALLDGSGFGLLLRTTSLANRFSFGMLGRSQQQIAKLFERLTGHRLLLDLNQFYATFDTVIDGFRARAAAMERTLRSDATAFVLVLLPEADADLNARRYHQRLQDESMHLAGLLFNQVQPSAELTVAPERALALLLAAGLSEARAHSALQCQQRWSRRASAQRALMSRWEAATSVPWVGVPRLSGTVSSLADLTEFASALGESD